MKEIDVALLQTHCAVECYSETPRTVTAVTHADETDDSEFHCVLVSTKHNIGLENQSSEGRPYCIKKSFRVPRQKLEIRLDKRFGIFYLIKVVPQFGIPLHPEEEYCLVAHTSARWGFLVPLNDLNMMDRQTEEMFEA